MALPTAPAVVCLYLTMIAGVSLSFIYAFIPFMVVSFPELGLESQVCIYPVEFLHKVYG